MFDCFMQFIGQRDPSQEVDLAPAAEKENKFIVGGGSQITLFEWTPNEFRLLSSQADLQLMKCFAWSPDPDINDLVAVGSSTGKVELWRLEANRYANNNVVSGGPELSLPGRSTRNCNALAFCSEKPNLLAVGLDKVRGDPSLVVWDIESVAAAAAATGNKYGSSNVRSSAAMRTERPHFQYALAEVVTSVAFLPFSTDLLVAGVSNLWLRLFDLRVTTGLHVAQAPASKLHGIVTDPFDSHRISCYGEGTVTVWDSRKITQPLLTFTSKDAAADGARHFPSDTFSNVEFSPVRRGMLATLTRDANHVRFWDIQRTPSFETRQSSDDQTQKDSTRESARSSRLSRLSWAAPSTMLPWSASPEQPRSPSEPPAGVDNAVLTNTSKTKAFPRPLMSFALAPSRFAHPLTSNIIVVSKEGDIEMHEMHDVPKHTAWSSRGELALGAGTQFRVFPGYHESEPPPEPWELEANIEASWGTHNSSKGRSNLLGSQTNVNDRRVHRRNSGDRPSELGSSIRRSSLTATRRANGGTYSPASIRQYAKDHPVSQDGLATPSLDQHGLSFSEAPRDDSSPQEITSQLGNKNKRVDLSRSASRGRKRLSDALSPTIIKTDISMVMRSRVLQGYGLLNANHNSKIIGKHHGDDAVLSEVWTWFHLTLPDSKHLLTFGTSKIHGIDFSYQGILGIWEGLEASASQEVVSLLDSLDLAAPSETSSITLNDSGPSVDVNASLRPHLTSSKNHRPDDGFHGNYTAALNTLNSRSNADKSMWRPTVHTDKNPQRRLALALCNWRVGEEEFLRWEKEGKHSQAACWLLFTNQGGRAIEMLMRSKNESHQMMSGTFAAMLQSGSSSKNRELQNYCERLIVKLQDPHFRIMLSYIVFNDWNDVLEEEALPLRERIAIALRFLEDKDLTSYLRRVADDCRAKGSIEGLIVTGLTPRGLDIIQGYVDTTGDVQSAAILASYVCPGRYKDTRAERWVEAYRDLLDGWKLFHHRCQFDIDRGKILQEGIQNGDFAPMEWVKKQFLIRCNFCNKVVNTQQQQRPQEPIAMQRRRAAACPWCGRALPRCSVCLMSVCIIPDSGRENDFIHSSFRGHAGHIIEWFLAKRAMAIALVGRVQ
ncbi:WD40 repeat-like protein [Phellopilus nigrolimitatus]|nr:WD40 repeat-like protein [Phellopilus nigrolimitatus]